MTRNKKSSIKLSILLTFFIAVSLSGCFSPWQGNNAKFVISFAGAERSAFSRDAGETEEAVNIRDLEHRIELTRESEKITFSGKGTTVEGYAPAGNWAISVYSYFGGELYAAGDGEISLQDGQENVITITMRRAYKVTFNSNGGIGEVPPITVMNGDSVELPSGDGLYKEGFDFIGWNTDEYGTGTHYSEGETYPAVTGNITLYAVWVPLVTDDVPITNPAVIITAPVKGVAPDTVAAISNAANFSAGTVSWEPEDSAFKGGVVYTATVTLIADNGFTFIGLETATINGQTAVEVSNTGTAVTLSYTFAKTSDKTAASIAIKTQPNKWTYTHLDTLDLTGLVVTLTYDDGQTEDVPFASFVGKNITANPSHGNELTYQANNGVPVTVSYGDLNPATTDNLIVKERVINIKTINGVTVPVTGAVAVTSIGATDEYTVNIAWSPAVSGTFAPATTYTATITIAPKTGFTVQGLEANFFSVAGATSVNFNSNTGVITAVFPVTATLNFTSATTLTLKAGTGKLFYTLTSSPAADNYVIYYKAGNNLSAADVKTGQSITLTAAGSGEITGLTNGTAYSVIVTANKQGYYSSDSPVRTEIPGFSYIINGSGTEFTSTRYGVTVGTADQTIQNVIDAIRTNAGGEACSIQFGNGTNTLDIGTVKASFNSTGGTWGLITLTGKITSSVTSSSSGTIEIANDVSVISTADIANTESGCALYKWGTGTFTISGGTVSATTSNAIYNAGVGKLIVSQALGFTTLVTSATKATNSYVGTIRSTAGQLEITGGTVENTAVNNGYLSLAIQHGGGTLTITGGTVSGKGAIYSYTTTDVINISGGMVQATGDRYAIERDGNSVGTINISGNAVISGGATYNAIYACNCKITVSGNAMITSSVPGDNIHVSSTLYCSGSSIEITGGTIQNTSTTAGWAVLTASDLTMTGGTVSAMGTGSRAIDYGNGVATITGGTILAPGESAYTIYNKSEGVVTVTTPPTVIDKTKTYGTINWITGQ